MRVNISEVAKKAGVSTATVSRVLNNSPLVSTKTKERVLKIIEKLGYVPNHVARSLRSRRTGLIATIIPYSAEYVLSFPYFSIFIKEVARRLAEDGYHLLLTTEEPDDDPIGIYRAFLDRKIVDGFIILDLKEKDERISFLTKAKAKFVVVGRTKDCRDIPFVDTDNMGGACEATTYLLEKNCERILFINGPEDHSVSIWREKGYRAAYERKGLRAENSLILTGNFREESAYKLVKGFSEAFDAIFTASDLMAIGALRALKEMNRSVPVIGFDDIPQAQTFSPALSTIRQPIDKVGYEVANSIIVYLETGKKVSKVLDVELIIRESTEVKR